MKYSLSYFKMQYKIIILGFSVLELMVCLSILSVIGLFGLYNYQGIIQRAHASTTMHELFYQLHLARSEAIKRNVSITVCPSANQTACMRPALASSWTQGWIGFEDQNENQEREFHEKRLFIHDSIQKGDKLFFKGALTNKTLTFTAEGTISKHASSFLYCPQGIKKYAKAIILNRGGRLRIAGPMKLHMCDN